MDLQNSKKEKKRKENVVNINEIKVNQESVQTFLAIFSNKSIFTYTFKRVTYVACHTATTVMAWRGKTWRLPREEGQNFYKPHLLIE